MRRRRQLGTLAQLDAPTTTTLNTYVVETWTPIYAVLLAPRTQEVYAQSYDRHIAPTLGELLASNPVRVVRAPRGAAAR